MHLVHGAESILIGLAGRYDYSTELAKLSKFRLKLPLHACVLYNVYKPICTVRAPCVEPMYSDISLGFLNEPAGIMLMLCSTSPEGSQVLKGVWHEIFSCEFFSWISFPGPLSIPLGPFQIFSNIHGDIREWMSTTPAIKEKIEVFFIFC